MRMVLNEPIPVEVTDLLARRRALGQDTHDEVWNGEYHMNAAPNAQHARLEVSLHVVLHGLTEAAGLHLVGAINVGNDQFDFRVPDTAVLRHRTDEIWLDDAAIVVEILSPHDESWEKFEHYARFGVVEIFIVDPDVETVQIFVRSDDDTGFAAEQSSSLLGIAAADLTSRLDW